MFLFHFCNDNIQMDRYGDPFAGFPVAGNFLLVIPGITLISLVPFARWLQLREYRNHGTIDGISAHML
jgi:hypothetical protein